MNSLLQKYRERKNDQAWSFLVVFFCCLPWSASMAEDFVSLPEKKLITGLNAIKNLSFNEAFYDMQDLAKNMPKYQLAQLMKADLYAIKAGKSDWVTQKRTAHARKSEALLSEAKVRWQRKADLERSRGDWDALLAQYVLKTSREPYLVIVDSAAHRLYLYQKNENGYEEVANYYVSIGQKGTGKQVRGDLKTPIGIYKIEKELSDSKLPELYGVAALTLNYPNSWDKQKGRTGSGIWLHGTPRSTYSRPPLASRGCVVLNNPAMQTLIYQYRLAPATPVIIAQSAQRSLIDRNYEDKQQVLSQINQWLRSQQNYQVDWSRVSVFAYPGEQGVYYVSFPLEDGKLVEQYWQRQGAGGSWQMVYETFQKSKVGPHIS
uniref:L,D-TPase catalytic domain-containing protein n=1 Tax=Hydrogenovibrio crunogenus (strain DSM 25203 / XCL-2) TaxID=317025 RepID=Q31ES9_HYDCU